LANPENNESRGRSFALSSVVVVNTQKTLWLGPTLQDNIAYIFQKANFTVIIWRWFVEMYQLCIDKTPIIL
jgi:hypothetical protein